MEDCTRQVRAGALAALAILTLACAGASATRSGLLQPAVATDRVTDDPDDPAIWLDRQDPSRSLILGTNKVAAPSGALVVFGLDGRTRQTVANLDRPNNVDVEYDVTFDGRTIDIAVTTERLQHRLRVFRISATAPHLTEVGAVPVLEGQTGERGEPMGIALYRRPTDHAVFAIVAPKTGDANDYLWQYRLTGDGRGGLLGTLVRRFGTFSQAGPAPDDPGEIEAVAVDDATGYVYYADERFGIRVWHADPDHPDAGREIRTFGRDNYQMDREGLAVYARGDGTGYLVSTDQIPGASRFKLYRREDVPDVMRPLGPASEIATGADATDGIDVTSAPLPGFPQGLLVVMNSRGRNFLIFRWPEPAAPGGLPGALQTAR